LSIESADSGGLAIGLVNFFEAADGGMLPGLKLGVAIDFGAQLQFESTLQCSECKPP
jgi:hypothetical protein